MNIPPGFFAAEAVEVGYALGYRVLYTLYKGKWHGHTMDLRADFGGGETLEVPSVPWPRRLPFF